MGDINGVRSAVDLKPVDAQEAVDAVVGGRLLVAQHSYASGTPSGWTVHRGPLPADRHTYAEHACGSTAGYKPLPAPGGPVGPPVPPAAPSTPSSAPQAASWSAPGARSAASRTSDAFTPRCHECGQPCDRPGSYFAFEHAGRIVYAVHVDGCTVPA